MKGKPAIRTALALALAASLTVLSACGSNDNGTGTDSGQPSADGEKTINIGVTYALSGINPLSPNGVVSTYVDELMFPPLVELDSDLKFKPMLADSIETTDNKTFTIKLNPEARWTDGSPVTADDVIFTLNLMTNAIVASNNANLFSIIEGLDNSGYLPDGKTSIDGVARIDDRTLTVTTKAPTTLAIFEDTIGRNLMTLPQEALKDIAPEDLKHSEFMQKPTVTDGPYKTVDIDDNHYVQMEANQDYFRGAPKIDRLNFKVLQETAVFDQLKSGKIDMNIPSAGVIPISDYDKIKSLKNVKTVNGPSIAMQFMYINEKVVPDAKQRQAISYAMNRQRIIDKLLKGAGEAVDGYFTSYSPYRDQRLKPVTYNLGKAKSLLKESGWDSGKALTLSVLSGDSTLEQASNMIAENLKAAGVNVKIQMTDLSTLLDKLVKMDYDLCIQPVSLSPINPLPDVAYFLQEGNPIGYKNDEAEKLLTALASEVDEAKIQDEYTQLQRIVAQDVPMPSIYATKALGAVNNRVTGATPKDFGMFINVNEWDVSDTSNASPSL